MVVFVFNFALQIIYSNEQEAKEENYFDLDSTRINAELSLYDENIKRCVEQIQYKLNLKIQVLQL